MDQLHGTLWVKSWMIRSKPYNLNVWPSYPGFHLVVSHSNCFDDASGVFLTSFYIFMYSRPIAVRSSAVKQISKIILDQIGSRHIISINYVLDVSSIDGNSKERLVNIGDHVTSRHQRPEERGARPGVGNNYGGFQHETFPCLAWLRMRIFERFLPCVSENCLYKGAGN